MILQALVKRYEDTGGIAIGWQSRPADYAINLGKDGRILEVIDLEEIDGKKKKRRMLLLPEEPAGRTRGIKAALLCDNAGYIFGIDPKGRGDEKFAASKKLHTEVLNGVDSLSAYAILAFFEQHPNPVVELPDIKNNCVLMVEGNYAHEDEAIALAWNRYKETEKKEDKIRCLVSGEQDTIAALHGKVSLPGVSMGAVPLVSVNSESFASYGNTMKSPAAKIGEKTAFAYTTALNELLKSENHRQRMGTDTIVYWAEGDDENAVAAFNLFSQPTESDSDKLSAIMEKVARGEAVDIDGCNMGSRFYLLCLSPNAGRISVRFFYQDSFSNIITNIIEHYSRLEIVVPKSTKYRILPPWMLLSETTVKKSASDAVPLLGGQLLRSIVTGSAYPQTLYNAIMTRCRANEEIGRTKAAIIKAVLIRNYNEREVTTVSLNEQSNNRPYVLGRLFAVLERLQVQAAGGSLNATIRDRYFASACANPKSVFPTLLKLSMHHSAKLGEGAEVYFEKIKTNLLGRLDETEPFPAALPLDDQGRFILGYYHQTQDFFVSKKDKEEKDND
jgi:CRISPR-associated protein Csd1